MDAVSIIQKNSDGKVALKVCWFWDEEMLFFAVCLLINMHLFLDCRLVQKKDLQLSK